MDAITKYHDYLSQRRKQSNCILAQIIISINKELSLRKATLKILYMYHLILRRKH